MELRQIHTATLDLSLGRLRQLPEALVRQKMESLRSKGQLTPLVAAEQDGVLILVDGFVRHLAATRLGLESVLVEVVVLSPVQMKVQLYLRNRERGLLLFEECRLVRELSELDGLSQVEIGDLLERHKSWVCRRLSLCRALSPLLYEALSLGLLGGGSLGRLAQLPPCNQEEVFAVVQREGLTARETMKLLELYRRAPGMEARRYVLEHPREALRRSKRRPEAPLDPRLGEAGRALQAALLALLQIALRIGTRLRDGLGELPLEGMEILKGAHQQAEEACVPALSAVAQFLSKRGTLR